MNKNLKLLEPITINGMTLKNRLANAPFGSIPSGGANGECSTNSLNNCRSLFESGIGLLMCGPIRVVPEESQFVGNDGIAQNLVKRPVNPASIIDDSYIEGWKQLSEMAHSYGCMLGAQIGEWGPQGSNSMSEQIPAYEMYKSFSFGEKALADQRIWTIEELNNLVEYVAQGTRRYKEAGFDCVELHSAHSTGLLYANALDPFFNHRDDEFGGDVHRSLQLHIKTIKRMRELVGDDYPILIRINGDDLKGELGNTTEDICKHVIPILEKAGYDAIDLSFGGPAYTTHGPLPPMYYPRGFWMDKIKQIKESTKLPVLGVGRLTSIEMCEKYLEEGYCDIIYMGRQIFADKNTLQNYLDGKKEYAATRQCIACLKPGCINCTLNYEDRYNLSYVETNTPPKPTLETSENPRKVLVIGGGVAGMEAAAVAKIKGHDTTLWEKEGVLGGIASILATTPLTSEFQNVADYQIAHLAELGVDVRCCYEASLERIKAFAPDVVILATGSSMVIPDSVKDGLMVMDHLEAMKRKREFRSLDQFKKKIVIYGFTASEFALDLAEAGADVTLMGAGAASTIGAEGYMCRERKFFIRRKLTDINFIRRSGDTYRVYNPNVIPFVKLEGVDKDGVHYYHNGMHKTMPYDVLIISGAKRKNDELLEELKTVVPEVYAIGDCEQIGTITTAIHAAHNLVRTL